jgi:hypothetical protein
MTPHEIDVLHTAMTDARAWRGVTLDVDCILMEVMSLLPVEVQQEVAAEIRVLFQITDAHLRDADR